MAEHEVMRPRWDTPAAVDAGIVRLRLAGEGATNPWVSGWTGTSRLITT